MANCKYITKEQYELLISELEGHEDILLSILKHYNLERLALLEKSEYPKVRSEIARIKKAKELGKKC